jgi:hypothetical protein
MGQIGMYCKAYPLERFLEFDAWDAERSGPSFLYLQENLVVTRDIFIDEDVVFDRVTPEWAEFCKSVLKFEPPAPQEVAEEASTQDRASEA